jgi:hypothetical protein
VPFLASRSVSRLRRKGSECQMLMLEEPKKPTRSDKFLKCLELISVSLIALSIWLSVGLAGLWIIFGYGTEQKARLSTALCAINLNWKIGFLLLIPLFYRTVREILERIEEGPGGTKFPRAKTSKTPEEPPETEGETKPAPKEAT